MFRERETMSSVMMAKTDRSARWLIIDRPISHRCLCTNPVDCNRSPAVQMIDMAIESSRSVNQWLTMLPFPSPH